tara:strand:+ start:9218 stop:9589 length:372 start_codon:yes stop_codon:yes gene_type:complete
MKKNNLPICYVFLVFTLGLVIQFAPLKVLATETQDSYAFMSAQDLYDALSQQSQVALGYMLGIVDAKKGSQPDGSCFAVPWQPDADEVLVNAYLDYWPSVADFSMKAPEALTQLMTKNFPCDP